MSAVTGSKSAVALHDGPAVPAQRIMPDVGSDRASIGGVLDRVGMSGIEVPIRVPGQCGGVAIFGRADAYVDLVDPQAKGIHMSRLYRQLVAQLQAAELSVALLQQILQGFVESHAGISRLAQVQLAFELPIERASLRSGKFGWRAYPVEVEAVLEDGGLRVWLTVSVTYSSTCPCSAALARQLIQERFQADFAGRDSVRTDEVAAWLTRPESIRGGKGTDTATPPPFWPSWASWRPPVATAGFASKFWSERTPGEVQGSAVSVPFGPPRERRVRRRKRSRGVDEGGDDDVVEEGEDVKEEDEKIPIPLPPGPLPGCVLTRISRRIQPWQRGISRRPRKAKTAAG